MENFLPKKRKKLIILTAILMLGAILRLYLLDKKDLWFDERESIACAMAINNGNASLFEKIRFCFASDLQAILHTLILGLWFNIFTPSTYSARLLSAIPSIITIYFVFLLAKRIYTEREGIIAGMITALSPLHIWYAQEVRPYSVNLLFLVIFSYLFILSLEKENKTIILGASIFGVLSMLSNHISLFFIYPFSLILLFIYKKKLRTIINILAPATVTYLFYFIFFFANTPNLTEILKDFWIKAVAPRSILYTLAEITAGYHGKNIYLISTSTALILIAGAIISEKDKKIKTIVISAAAGPVLTLFLFSVTIFKLYLTRYILIASVPIYILAARGTVLKGKINKILGLILMASMIAANIQYYKNTGFEKKDFLFHYGVTKKTEHLKDAFAFFNNNVEDGDIYAIASWSLLRANSTYASTYAENTPHKWDFEWKENTGNSRPKKIKAFFFEAGGGKSEYFYKVVKSEMQNFIFDLTKKDIRNINFNKLWLFALNWDEGKEEKNLKKAIEWCGNNLQLIEKRKFGKCTIYIYSK